MAKGHGRNMRMLPLRCDERCYQCRDLWVDPELLMKTLNQLKPRSELPCELPEDLILFVLSWELWIGTRLTVVVAQILNPCKEPKSIAIHRPAEIRREVAIPD